MRVRSTQQQIKKITLTIIDSTLLIGSILGLFVYLISLFNYSNSSSKLPFLIDFFVVAVLLIISIYRKKISIEIKSIIIILSLFLLINGDVYKLGIYSDSKIFLIIIPFYSFVVVVIMRQYSKAYLGFIADLEQSNKKISDQERNYRQIFNSSTDAIFIHDLNGKILDVNDSMLKMYGYEKKDILNINIAELSSGKEGYTANNAGEFVKKAINDNPQVFDWQAKKKNGEYFWLRLL